MLKKENRLKSKKAFDATYKNNNVVANDLIVLYIGKKKTNENCPVRVGFVVSKKIHKRAVKRNKIKRILRENLRLMLMKDEYNLLKQYQSLIFCAKNNILDKTYGEINSSILFLFEKIANKKI